MTHSKKRSPNASTSRAARRPGPYAASSGGGSGAPSTSPPGPGRWWLWPALGTCALLLAALAGWTVTGRRSTRADAPLDLVRTPDQNVLLVTIDTLRADALGCYGGRATTPALDRLAADGIRYDFAHAHAVVTLPSHTSILTGLYPFAHGVRDNSGFRVAPGTTTLATLLKARGYATGAFIGGFPLDGQFGLDAGFDVYDDQLPEVRGPADFAMAERPANAVVAPALAWLRRQPSRWFAWVHVYDPHAPTRPPEPYASQYASDLYAGEVAFTDVSLGPLFDHVRQIGDRPTLVIVTADHGEARGDHGEATHGIFAYESTLRVPLIVTQLRAGRPAIESPAAAPRVSSFPVQHADLLPTVLDALGLPVAAGLPGRSLAGLGRQEADERGAYFEALSASLNRGWAPLHGVLVGREKYIDLPLPELYDLAADPGEERNLESRNVPRRRALETRLRQFGSTAPGTRRAEDPETEARLRSLGYVSGARDTARKTYTAKDDPKRLIAVDQAIQRGIALFQDGKPGEAEAIYRRLVAERPDMTLAYEHLAFLQWELGQRQAAIATLRTAVAKAAPDPEVESRLGIYLSETGSVAEAIPLLERAVQHPGSGVDALNTLGIAYARADQPEQSIEVFRRILAIDPRNAMALQNIGSAHLQAGRLAPAIEAFNAALAINPSWAPAWNGLGAAEIQRGNRPAAITAWRRAVNVDPSNYDALFNLATELINARQFGEARPYLERFVQTAPPAEYGKDIENVRAMLTRLPQ